MLSLVFKGLYAPEVVLAALLHAAGWPAPAWLLDPRTALPAIMAMDVWSASGYYMIIFLAGLESIPRELYDAARLEGASGLAPILAEADPALFDPRVVQGLLAGQRRGLRNAQRLYALALFELWRREYRVTL